MKKRVKVLLLSPPYLPRYMRNARCDFISLSATQWYPIWLGYCGALLEKHGYEVALIDSPSYGLSKAETELQFNNFKPNLLVVYTGHKSEKSDIEYIDRILDEYDCPAVLVGPYFSIDPARILGQSRRVKYGVSGEFEYPVLELLSGKDPREIRNLLIREKDEIKTNPSRVNLTRSELDGIPFVSDFFNRHLDLRHYRVPSELHPFLDIMSGRGCSWGLCTYCLWVHSFIKGRTYNTRSLENVTDEFKYIEKSVPSVRSVMIQDDTFPEDRAIAFSEAKIRADIKLPWSCYARGELGREALRIMKRANCRNLHVGFESGDRRILKDVRKGLTRERMTQFMRDAKEAGLRVHGDFAIGFPGETKETAARTIEWACKLRPHTAQFQLMIPFPGTPFYKELEKNGWMINGAPDYPHLSQRDMERIAKRAYHRYYLSLPFVGQVLRHPYELFFSRLRTYWEAAGAVLWKKWNIRG